MGSFLATLNAREGLRQRSVSGQTFQLSTVSWNRNPPNAPNATNGLVSPTREKPSLSMRFNNNNDGSDFGPDTPKDDLTVDIDIVELHHQHGIAH